MSKKYKFYRPWKRWNAGDVIDAYEYKRLPIEVKKSCITELIEPEKIEIETSARKAREHDLKPREKEIPKNPFSTMTAWSPDVEKDLENSNS